jgi:hypothetical protein
VYLLVSFVAFFGGWDGYYALVWVCKIMDGQGFGACAEPWPSVLLKRSYFKGYLMTMSYKEYRRGIRISGIQGSCICPGKRGKIGEFSEASRKRLQWEEMQGLWKSMLTLTYHRKSSYFNSDLNVWDGKDEFSCDDFRLVKRHLNCFLQELRERKIDYLWALEFQKRGVVHFHVMMNRRFTDCQVENDVRDGDSWRVLMDKWLRVSGQSTDKDAVWYGNRKFSYTDWEIRSGSGYLSKYMAKNRQKCLPVGVKSVGRWWGCTQGLKKELRTVFVSNFIVDREEKNDAVNGWKKFRNNVKKLIEKKTGYLFPRGKKECDRGIRFILKPELVECVNVLAKYYLTNVIID